MLRADNSEITGFLTLPIESPFQKSVNWFLWALQALHELKLY